MVNKEQCHQSLLRLIQVAKSDTGQSMTIRRFLLGLYDGYNFPFSLVELRGVDREILDDTMKVLYADATGVFDDEIHVEADKKELFCVWSKEAQQQC